MSKPRQTSPVSMEEVRRIALVIIFLAILTGVGYLISRNTPSRSASLPIQTSAQVNSARTINYDGAEGKTALELLQVSHQVEAQESSVGSFVTSIDGVKNTDSQFWMYYINGQAGTVASDQYKTQNNDKIEWRYEEFR